MINTEDKSHKDKTYYVRRIVQTKSKTPIKHSSLNILDNKPKYIQQKRQNSSLSNLLKLRSMIKQKDFHTKTNSCNQTQEQQQQKMGSKSQNPILQLLRLKEITQQNSNKSIISQQTVNHNFFQQFLEMKAKHFTQWKQLQQSNYPRKNNNEQKSNLLRPTADVKVIFQSQRQKNNQFQRNKLIEPKRMVSVSTHEKSEYINSSSEKFEAYHVKSDNENQTLKVKKNKNYQTLKINPYENDSCKFNEMDLLSQDNMKQTKKKIILNQPLEVYQVDSTQTGLRKTSIQQKARHSTPQKQSIPQSYHIYLKKTTKQMIHQDDIQGWDYQDDNVSSQLSC